MRTILTLSLALGATSASAVGVVAPRVVAPAVIAPLGALPRPTLVAPAMSLTPSLGLNAPSLAPALPPLSAPALTLAPSLLPAPVAAPAAADAPTAKGSLENAAAALSAPNADQAAASAKTFDALKLSAANDGAAALPGPSFRGPDHYENQKIGNAVGLLSRTPIGRDIYAKAYNDYGSRLQVLVDDNHSASYDARLHWQNGAPVLSLTRDLLSRGSDAAVAAFLVREMSHLYYKDFPDSTERSWMAHSVMARTYAEITNSGPRYWDHSNDLNRDGRYVMRSFYESWTDGLNRHNDPRYGTFFSWLKTGSDSKSGPNAGMSLRELYDRGLLRYDTYRQMNAYFISLIDSERNWLAGRR